jgi:hypothetical protein
MSYAGARWDVVFALISVSSHSWIGKKALHWNTVLSVASDIEYHLPPWTKETERVCGIYQIVENQSGGNQVRNMVIQPRISHMTDVSDSNASCQKVI